MQPIAQWPAEARRQVIGVFTDIDDTLTTDGDITPDALAALGALRNAGLPVIAVTGRPIGWSESLAASWPLEAIVAENGAVALLTQDGPCARRYQQDAQTRRENYARMQRTLARIEAEIPGARRATDSAGRECDIAIDHSEFAHLPASTIDMVAAMMRADGLKASVSSIHINGWIGDHDKLQGAGWILRELWQRDLAREIDRWAFIGDSTNDQLMFEAFVHSVGVANVMRFVEQLHSPPRFITRHPRGRGFQEFARALLAARGDAA